MIDGNYMSTQKVDFLNSARNTRYYSRNINQESNYNANDLIQKFATGYLAIVFGESGYEIYIPQEIKNIFTDVNIPAVVTVNDMVSHARKTFGLNAVQVATLIGVSRASLYNHLNEDEQPSSIDVYQKLYNVSQAVSRAINVDIQPGLKSIVVDGKTLLGHLKFSIDDTDKIVNICRQIEQKISNIKSKRNNLSVEQQRHISRSHSKIG